MSIKSIKYKRLVLLQVFILKTYALLVAFNGFPVFEIRKNLDLRKILVTPQIFLLNRDSTLLDKNVNELEFELSRM